MSDETLSKDPSGSQPTEESLLDVEDPLLQPRRLSLGWRVFVAASVCLAAGAGGAIGAAVPKIGCEECGMPATVIGAVLGAVFAGIGMAIMAVLIARSFEEWRRHH